MPNKSLPLNEFTDSLAGMFEFVQENSGTNAEAHKKALKILSKVISGELTERQRECIFMRYYQNLTVTEIACRLGVGKSTVSRHISKAKKRLYKVLKYYTIFC